MRGMKRHYTLPIEVLLIAFAIVFIGPILLVALNALKSDGEILKSAFSLPEVWKLDNFTAAWQEMKFPKALFHSFFVSFIGIAGIVGVSSLAGYKLSRTKTWYSHFIFYLCIIPMIISFSSIMITLMKMAKALYLIHSLWGLAIIYWGLLAPGAIFLYHGFVKSIPRELDESASIDGCSPIRTFTAVIFPLLMPVTSTVVVLNSLAIWNDFLLPLLVVGQAESTKTLMLATYSFQGTITTTTDWGHLMAGLFMSVLPVIFFFILMQRFIVQGITAGAVKG